MQAFLVRDPLNIMYLTGYWHTTTERPQAVYMNRDDADPWFLYPGLDRDIYDPEHGVGFNWSDTVVVGIRSGYRMSRVPYSKEWCWLKL